MVHVPSRLFRRIAVYGVLPILLVFADVPTGLAGEHPAARVINDLGREVETVLADRQRSEEERQRTFRDLLKTRFDTAYIAGFVLGRYRNRAGEDERRAFESAFVDYIVATYARRLGRYEGEMPRVEGVTQESDPTRVTVRSQLTPPDGPTVKINWRLRNRGQGWRIVDVVVEGVSLGLTQRAEFASFLRANNGRIAALTGALEKKVARLN